MIFAAIRPPQYIVIRLTDGEMKDIIGYSNKHLTKKTSIQIGIFEKCGCLVSAIYQLFEKPKIDIISEAYRHKIR